MSIDGVILIPPRAADDDDTGSVIVHSSPNGSHREDDDLDVDVMDGLHSRVHTPDPDPEDADPLHQLHTHKPVDWDQLNTLLGNMAATNGAQPATAGAQAKDPLRFSPKKKAVIPAREAQAAGADESQAKKVDMKLK